MNTLTRDFAVPGEHAKRCAKIFRDDMASVGLLHETPTGTFVASEAVPTLKQSTEIDQVTVEAYGEGTLEDPTSEVLTPPAAPPPTAPVEPDKPKRPKAIFIGHGPSKTPLNQLTKILSEYKLPHKVVEYEPNAGHPISEKVADAMRQCGAAILIFTADQELRDLDGNPIWLSSGNVAHELGAAAWAYENRIVIFKEEGVNLPSNYSGIGYIEFEKDKLEAHAVELFRELVNFGLVTISVGE